MTVETVTVSRKLSNLPNDEISREQKHVTNTKSGNLGNFYETSLSRFSMDHSYVFEGQVDDPIGFLNNAYMFVLLRPALS